MALRPGAPEEAGLRPEGIARARELCAEWVKSGHTPAIGVCVARRGIVALHEAWGGLRPGEDAPPLALDSIFPLMSLTKPLTATLVMQLVEDGLLGLNRPVRDYLPEVGAEGSQSMLVHHLLTHTSGWADYDEPAMTDHVAAVLGRGFDPPPCPEGQHPQVHQLLHLFAGAPLLEPPGRKMIYADFNYVLLGEIVRRVSGKPLEQQARERLFDPLGMDATSYSLPDALAGRVVDRPPEAPLASPQNQFMQGLGSAQWREIPLGGGGAFSTTGDMATFGQVFLDRGRRDDTRVLSPAAVAAMTRDQIPGTPALFRNREVTPASWGYGWMVESPARWRYFHGSLWPLGAHSHPGHGGTCLWIDPVNEIVAAYFEVLLRESGDGELLWNADLFQNAIQAAAI